MGLGGVDAEPQPLARRGPDGRVELRGQLRPFPGERRQHHVGSGGSGHELAGDGPVHDHAVPQRLHDLDRELHGRLAFLRDPQVLRAQPDDHVAVGEPGDRERQVARRGHSAPRRRPQQVHGRAPDEAGDEQVGGQVVDILRWTQLLQDPARHHSDAIAERHRLHLVVGDVDGRDVHPLVQPLQIPADLHAELGVQVRQRLVQQERRRLTDERPAHRDALPLPAGELRRPPAEEIVEAEHRADAADADADLVLRNLPLLEAEGEVLVHGHVRVQRVVLEHHRDVAVARGDVVDHAVADGDGSGRGLLQAGDHPKRRRLPAPGGSDQDHELAVAHREREVVHGHGAVVEDLGHAIEREPRHGQPFNPEVAMPRMKYRCAAKNNTRIGSMLNTFAAINRFVFVECAPWNVDRPSCRVMFSAL